ncbi:hypothetical protein GJ633_05185 [Halorubrum sp. CBA1125]|uniref:hypothetical protein n=1 Tax=Halorubrum sp. CBA1125 TaxID=2668072 RepID=UPI0012E7FAE9|nr:hypothetical protein [Halorubrum sp. CBA1125]MUW14118.1 hypothetical protein [Halorubrum sp. CBA1125]
MDPVFLQFETLRSVLYYGVVYGIVLAVAAWIYRDAKARGSDRALAWFLATLVFTIVPVLVYLYLNRDAGPGRRET